MDIELVPTLQVLRDLYTQPNGMDRFRSYLSQMIGETEDGEPDVVLPIMSANPMGKEHCLPMVERLLDIEAEAVVAGALEEAGKRLAFFDARARVALNLVDDLGGSWTDRYFTEAELRLGSRQQERANRMRRFVVVPCWTSERYTPDLLRKETLAAVFRLAWRDSFGLPESLGAMLTAEGNSLRFAGVPLEGESSILAPVLPREDLEYANDVIESRLNLTDYPTLFTCMFGDDAAGKAGYRQLGLRPRAGFAVALSRAMKSSVTPEQALALPGGVGK